jgi:hypothetical protein
LLTQEQIRSENDHAGTVIDGRGFQGESQMRPATPSGSGFEITIPDLTDTCFALAEQVLPVVRQRSRGPKETELRPFFEGGMELAAAFGFAASLLSLFLGAFLKELGKQVAKKLMTPAPTAKPGEVSRRLEALQRDIQELRLSCSSRQELQAALDKALTTLTADLQQLGLTEEEARTVTAKVESVVATRITA